MQTSKQIQLEQTQLVSGRRTPAVIGSTIVTVTGDIFVASTAKKNIVINDLGADTTELDIAAVVQICCQFKIPCLVIRSLRDSADENAKSDIKEFYKIAARNSANLPNHTLELFATK